MKPDGEPEYHHYSPTGATAANSIEYNENHLEADNAITMEGKQSFIAFTECKISMKVADPSHLGDGPVSCDSTDMDNCIYDNQKEGGHVVAPFSVPLPQFEMVKKETDFYTDKVVTDIELPKMIVCFENKSYHVIKDICIDEGLHSFDKGLIENEVDHKKVDNFSHSATDVSHDLANEKPVSGKLKSTTLNELPIIDFNKDMAEEPSFKCLEGGGKFDAIDETIDNSAEKIMATKLLPLQEFDRGHSQLDLSNFNCHGGIPQSVGDDCDISAHDSSNQGQSDQVAMEETNSTTSVACSAVQMLDRNSNPKGFPSNSKEETGSITFDFDSGPSGLSARIENNGSTEFQLPFQVINRSGPEEAAIDGLTTSARSSFVQHGHADSSFPGPTSLSGSIAYSGQIAYSGSISLRSDSSTTSTRSFAFPILPSEWNSSPIKMAKADRRHYRKKHGGLRLGLLCCRF